MREIPINLGNADEKSFFSFRMSQGFSSMSVLLLFQRGLHLCDPGTLISQTISLGHTWKRCLGGLLCVSPLPRFRELASSILLCADSTLASLVLSIKTHTETALNFDFYQWDGILMVECQTTTGMGNIIFWGHGTFAASMFLTGPSPLP